MTLTAPKQAPCLSSKRLLYLAWAVYTCEVYPILFCLHVHQDAKCLQPDIRVSALNSSAGKLAIAQEGDRIAGSSADARSLQPCRSQAAMGIAILSVADAKLCIDNKSRVTKDGNPTWLYQFKGSVAQQWNFVPRMDGLQSDCLKRGDDAARINRIPLITRKVAYGTIMLQAQIRVVTQSTRMSSWAP